MLYIKLDDRATDLVSPPGCKNMYSYATERQTTSQTLEFTGKTEDCSSRIHTDGLTAWTRGSVERATPPRIFKMWYALRQVHRPLETMQELRFPFMTPKATKYLENHNPYNHNHMKVCTHSSNQANRQANHLYRLTYVTPHFARSGAI